LKHADSEPAYFWYQTQVRTEARYFTTEAFPDWKHKAARIEHECFLQGTVLNSDMAETGTEAHFAKWFSFLKEEVQEWRRMVEGVEVPDFGQAVSDLMTIQAKEAAATVDGGLVDGPVDGPGFRKIEKVDSGIDF
jgi:hypothetical protein